MNRRMKGIMVCETEIMWKRERKRLCDREKG